VKALSIRQPFAWLIVHGFKDVENREWSTRFRGRIYVHAGKQPASGFPWAQGEAAGMTESQLIAAGLVSRGPSVAPYQYGKIIGEVDIVDCVTESESPWFEGPFGFVLANPVAYPRTIPYRGRPRFFDVELPVEVTP